MDLQTKSAAIDSAIIVLNAAKQMYAQAAAVQPQTAPDPALTTVVTDFATAEEHLFEEFGDREIQAAATILQAILTPPVAQPTPPPTPPTELPATPPST